MTNQITWFPSEQERIDEIKRTDKRIKRNWENAFQKWSNNSFIYEDDTVYGVCGYGSMCEWCNANDYGRPCVRALNAMCREKGISIDYSDRDFEKIWNM